MNPLLSYLKRSSLASALVLISAHAVADTKEQVMFSKFLKYGFCMEKTYGQPWTEKSKLQTAMNRWGAPEPTVNGIASARAEVRAQDLQCRIANGIQDEPRPH